MQLKQMVSKLKHRKLITCLAILAALLSVFSIVLPGPAGAANQANDSPNGLVPSLTVKVGTASVTNPTTIYTTARVFSPAEMTAMANVTQAYSYIDSFPTGVIDAAKGVKITDILAASGIDFSKVYRIYFYSNDVSNGPYTNLTKDYLWGSPRYYFPNIKNSWDYSTQSPSLSGAWGSPTDGAVPVDPILAVQDNWQRIFNIPEEGPLVDYSGQCNGSRYRLLNGQTMHDYADFHGDIWNDDPSNPGTSVPTAPKSVKWIYEIDVQVVTDGTGFTLNKTTDILSVNGTDQLLASFTTGTPPSTTLTWSSSNTAVATVSSKGLVTGKAAGTATITASGGGYTATCDVTVQSATVPVTGITLNRDSSLINVPNTDNNQASVEQLFATVVPSNATNKNYTYSSDNTAVATVNSSGTVTAVSAGTANITVTTADGGYTATCAVTVQDVYPATTMWLNKAVDTITAGATDQLTATIGTTGASQNVTWASSDTAVATVSDTGLVTAVAPGTANIIATNADGSLNATCAVTVQASTVAVTGVSLDKTSDTITAGGTDQLTATVAPADASNQEVTWASDNTTVATVDSTGLVTAVAPGTANITVTTADGGFTATCGVTVNAASVLTTLTLSGSPSLTYDNAPPTLDLSTLTLVGADQDGASYDISGMTVTWATVDASVSNSISGDIMTIYQSGNIFLTATVGGVTSNTLRIPIYNSDATTSVNLVVNGGSPVTVTAAQINALNTSGVLRAFSATKSNGATVYYTGLGASLADILSHYASVNSSQVQSIVVKASDGYVTSFPAAQTQLFNTRYYYPADGSAAQQVDTILATAAQGFVTSDPNQLDTVNTLRLFMGQANAGDKTANFCAKWVSEIDITVTVPVTGVSLDKSSETITTGGTDQLTATVTPADASNQEVTWASDNTAVATVDSTGLVTAVGAGTANITVTTADGGFTATCVVTVSSNVISINVTPASTTLNVGGTQAIGVTVDPADAGLSYASDNTSVATVSDGGVITAVAPGSAIIIITAEKAGYTTATASVLVNVNTSSPTGQTAPVWPAGSTVNAVVSANGQSVTLTWSAATDNTGVTGYRVYRNGTLATPVPVDGTSCNVTGLTAGTQYTFRVTAGNAAGNWTTTGPSVTVITTTPSSDRSAPYWPTGSSVTASGVTNAGLTLNWSAASDNVGVTSYRITRNGTQIATVDGGTSYNVTGLAANTSYTFRVTAGDAAGNWSRSSVYVTVTTP